MAEYRLRVITPGAGPQHKINERRTRDAEHYADCDAYLCGHCEIIVRRNEMPLEPVRCSNCGAINAPAVEE